MKMYVPEIGDHIILTEDWNFTLHPESRNHELGAYFGFSKCWKGWINNEVLPPMREFDYNVDYPNFEDFRGKPDGYHEYQRLQREAEQNCPEFVKYWADQEEWNAKEREK